MRSTTNKPQPVKPKDVAERIAANGRIDREKIRKSTASASAAADRLLRELDDVLKHLKK